LRGSPSQLVVFNQTGYDIIMSKEGVRQGDSLSSFLFALTMDAVVTHILQTLKESTVDLSQLTIMLYMDDITIACRPEDMQHITDVAVKCLMDGGFKPNLAKSSVLMPPALPKSDLESCFDESDSGSQRFATLLPTGLEIRSSTEFFKVLGTSVSENHQQTVTDYTVRINRFFDKLEAANLHPQIVFTILRFCGKLKLLYLCKTTPTEAITDLLTLFHQRSQSVVNNLVDNQVDENMLYDTLGCGMVDYRRLASSLFDASRTQCIFNVSGAPAELNTNLFSEAQPDASCLSQLSQHDASYLFYNGSHVHLTGPQFVMALAIRMRTLPRALCSFPLTCGCGLTLSNAPATTDHFIKCDKASFVTKTTRHNAIRVALTTVARNSGISCAEEPRHYQEAYDNGHERPDIFFNIQPPIVTDVSIVHPANALGKAAEQTVNEKMKEHKTAVASMGHIFIPFVLESYGHMHQCCHDLAKALNQALPQHLSQLFTQRLFHAVSSTLAIARGDAVKMAILRAVRKKST
jgi:hypothetical protein